jgi:hypothetical protein
MYFPYRPRYKFDASEYRPDAPQDDTPVEQAGNVSLEPFVRVKKAPRVPIHTRLFPVLTAEPPKPPVTYQDQETQTQPEVLASVPAEVIYVPFLRSEAAELLEEKIRLEQELDAVRLEVEKLSIELNAARSAEERRLAEDKMRLEQLEHAKEKMRLEKLERAAEEVRLAKEKTRLHELNMHTLQREKQVRQTLPLLRKPAAPAQAARKPVNTQPVKAAQALPRSRTFNTNNNRAAGK